MNSKQVARKWYKGKAQDKALEAAQLLDDSLAQGYWVSGAVRKCRAAFSKVNVKPRAAGLAKFASYDSPEYHLGEAVRFPIPNRLCRITEDCLAVIHDADQRAEYSSFLAGMRGLHAAMDKLDAARPAPVVTEMGASPTVTATLQNLQLKPETLRVCEIEWLRVQGEGGTSYVVGQLKWPEGTKFNATGYSRTANNHQCQACGHAIKNAFNWVPLIVDSAAGVPHAMWVGKDCAQTLFGVTVKGELRLTGNPAAPHVVWQPPSTSPALDSAAGLVHALLMSNTKFSPERENEFPGRAWRVGLKLRTLQQAMASGTEPRTPRNLRRLATLEREWNRLRKA